MFSHPSHECSAIGEGHAAEAWLLHDYKSGPSITFSRSGLTVNWSPEYGNILDLAEACDVPTRFSCRSGVCHMCETGVVAGTTSYVQTPLEPPERGSVLICSAAPDSDVVLDL